MLSISALLAKHGSEQPVDRQAVGTIQARSIDSRAACFDRAARLTAAVLAAGCGDDSPQYEPIEYVSSM